MDGEQVRLRWEKDTRYYEAHVEQDLWGGWVLTRIWGRRGTAMGQVRRAPCETYEEAVEKLAGIEKRRLKRGYGLTCGKGCVSNEREPASALLTEVLASRSSSSSPVGA